jgi:hypothetical protein
MTTTKGLTKTISYKAAIKETATIPSSMNDISMALISLAWQLL